MPPKIRAAALLLLLVPAAALAQSATPPARAPDAAERQAARAKLRAACSADLQKFCAGIERGKGATRACLHQHQSELSPACQAARAERSAMRAREKL